MPKGRKEGFKQSVLKQKHKRKKGSFKGAQEKAKASMDQPKEACVDITFVGEDDVVSEQVPLPAASVSSRKITTENSESSSNESTDAGGKVPEGYHLISMESLREFAKRIHSNSSCAAGEIFVCHQ